MIIINYEILNVKDSLMNMHYMSAGHRRMLKI